MEDCPDILAPGSEELLQFSSEPDSLPIEKRMHLDQCSTCQRRLQAYLHFDHALVARFYRRFCPDGTQLSLYCEDLLPPEERTQVASHLQDCPVCRLEVANTRLFFRDVPASMEESPSLSGVLRRAFGVLVKRQAQAVATRQDGNPAEDAWPRQYHIDGVDLSVHLSRASNGEQMLLGIMTSADNTERVDAFEGSAAELHNGSRFDDLSPQATPHARAHVDDLGNLIFRPVASGEYVLTVHLPGQDLIIEHLTIE